MMNLEECQRVNETQAEDDDDSPQLSEHTLAALREFYAEQKNLEKNDGSTGSGIVKEDWQLSQFWYDDATATALAKEAMAVAGHNGRIACVSCPTVYRKLRDLDPSPPGALSVVCLEFDARFAQFGADYVRYDYNEPLRLPEGYERAWDIVLCDPPFLSDECLRKTITTALFMSRGAILLCTGAVMEKLANELFEARMSRFLPKHANNLSNEFRCFTNYEPLILNGIED